MDIGSIVQLLLAAAIGAIVYGLIARALPGRQPGEDVIDKVFAKFDKTASEAAAKLQEAATKQAAAATILGRAATQVAQAAAGQAASGEAIAPSVAPTPTAAPIVAPAPVPAVTAPTWAELPSPWPIDARYLSAEQVARLTPDGARRANIWAQCWMTAAAAGNGGQNVAMALNLYRAGMTATADLGKPLDATWQAIFAAYGVAPPAVVQPGVAYPTTAPAPGTARPGEAAYDVRYQGYSAANPYVTVPE